MVSCPMYRHIWGVGLNGTPQRLGGFGKTKPYGDNTYHPLHRPFTLLAPFHSTVPPCPTNMAFPPTYLFTPPPSSCPFQHPTNSTGGLYTFPAPCPQQLDSTDNRVPSSIPSRWTNRGAEREACLPSSPPTLTPHRRKRRLVIFLKQKKKIKPSRGVSWKVNVPL